MMKQLNKLFLLSASVVLFTAFTIELGEKSSFSEEIQTENEYKATMDGWEVDLNVAFEKSKKLGLPILANFTGSDWCGWCIRLKKSVFTTKQFKDWAKENVVLLELDFPKRMKLPANIAQQNAAMSQAFGVQGYPTVWVFEMTSKPNGETAMQALAKTGYGPDAAAWIKDVESKMNASYEAMKKQ